MLTPVIIDRIKAMGIPTNSMVAAQQCIARYTEAAAGIKSNFDRNIEELTGVPVETKNAKVAELVFGYLIQESIRFYNMKQYIEIEDCIKVAEEKAAIFLVKNPWVNPEVIAEKHAEAVAYAIENEVELKKVRVPRNSGMSKKDRCLNLYKQNKAEFGDDKHKMMELFMKELGLSKAGATTYEYNCRKEIWK